MKNMRRYALACAGAAILALTAAGCHKSDDMSNMTKQQQQDFIKPNAQTLAMGRKAAAEHGGRPPSAGPAGAQPAGTGH